MKRVLLFLALLFGLVSIGLAMYSRGAKPENSSQDGAFQQERQAFSPPRSSGSFTF